MEYTVPYEKREGAPPIILIPGGDLLGTIYGTTADRREGWDLFFVRRGFTVYVIEPAGRGRSSFAVDGFNQVKAGLSMPDTQGTLRRWTGQAWVTWDQGPEPGVRGGGNGMCPNMGGDEIDNPEDCGGDQWPDGEAAYHQFLASLPVSGIRSLDAAVTRGLTELLEETGPAIVVGHSAGGAMLQMLASRRPELLHAVIAVEPAGGVFCGQLPDDLSNFARVPYFDVRGGLESSEPSNACANLIDRLRGLGGDASGLFLPDVGITGNGHIMMQELNNADIAQTLLNWIEEHAF